jgi:aminoglycoside/choline kinase family phosphotransferase
VLRDYHSPNLLWLPSREGVAQVGILDFQDALMGPAAYDVASLLMDARVDIPADMAITLLSRYVVGRLAANPKFSPDEFARQYVTLGAQRSSKILGIFARLAKRDGKRRYLAHLPRVWNYLTRALSHPSLAKLNQWYQENVPPPEAEKAPAEQPLSVS